jgi:hypothetical protein
MYWHGVAKLRLHTDSTLNLLEQLTTQFGTLLRRFVKDTEKSFSTTELPRETAARGRRRLAAQAKGKGKINRRSHCTSELSQLYPYSRACPQEHR